MNLVAFSIRTKGSYNFARRLRTVFTRFGFSESSIRHAFYLRTKRFPIKAFAIPILDGQKNRSLSILSSDLVMKAIWLS